MGVLAGKVAVITGSGRGLGLAIAQAYAREGAAVVLASRSSVALAEASAGLERQGARVSWHATDVGDLEQVKALAEHAVKTFGKIDVWVNNAGYGGVYGPTAAIDPQGFERVVRTDILGEYYGSWVALQHLLAQGNRRQADQPAGTWGERAGSFPECLCCEQSLGAQLHPSAGCSYSALSFVSGPIRPLSRQKRRSGWCRRRPMARAVCSSAPSRPARRSPACCASCADSCCASHLAIPPSRSRLLRLCQR